MDKSGRDKVVAELTEKGFPVAGAEKVVDYFLEYQSKGSNEAKISYFKEEFAKQNNEAGLKGVKEIESIFQFFQAFEASSISKNGNVEFDISLARGLSYYTGAIFEVKANNVSIGSISGGGRYDNLTGVFGLPNVSGVGISFGVDRIYDVMEELNLFPTTHSASTKVLICNMDAETEGYSLSMLYQLRQAGINSEVFPEAGKLKKPLNYANAKNIPFAIIIGSDERANGILTVKDMLKGEQERLSIADIIQKLK